jgi:signal peptidase I
MAERKRREEYPYWVKLGLWGLRGRTSVWVFVWLSVGCAIASCVYGYWDRRFPLVGVGFFCAAVMYWLTIRWVDRHGSWSSEGQGRSQGLRVLTLVVALGGVAALAAARLAFFGYYQLPQNGMYPGLPAGSRLLAVLRPYRDVSEVRPGDIVVFSHGDGGRPYVYIWRVVGLPGDRVRTARDAVLLNGEALPREAVRRDGDMDIFREANGEAVYEVAYGQRAPPDPPPEAAVTVPAGCVFVLGDNRDNARDSRYFGPIRFEAIMAKKW